MNIAAHLHDIGKIGVPDTVLNKEGKLDDEEWEAMKKHPSIGEMCIRDRCKENEGYAGRVNHPARQNHRIIPVTINHSDWFLQYSPYVYYNEHCIVFNGKHTPMKIEKATFGKLLD